MTVFSLGSDKSKRLCTLLNLRNAYEEVFDDYCRMHPFFKTEDQKEFLKKLECRLVTLNEMVSVEERLVKGKRVS